MGILKEAVESKKFDIRVMERNIERGLISPTEAEKFVKDLPDDSGNADWLNVEELAGDFSSGGSGSNGSSPVQEPSNL